MAELIDIVIKNRFTDKIILSGKYESIKDALEKNSLANLSGANLSLANLSGANLPLANLSRAKNAETAFAMTVIVPAGDIIGWKKCLDNAIVKLLIPAKAKRSNALGRKCRAEFVKVLQIFGTKEKTVMSNKDGKYTVGKITKSDKWDDCRWNECSNGIQ